MAGDITRHLAAAGRMPDVDRILEIELGDELGKIVGVGVHVVAGPGLARAAVATTVVCDAAVSLAGEEEHLIFERIGRQRPAVAEDNRLPRAPVVVIDLSAILGGERRHGAYSFESIRWDSCNSSKLARRKQLGTRTS